MNDKWDKYRSNGANIRTAGNGRADDKFLLSSCNTEDSMKVE